MAYNKKLVRNITVPVTKPNKILDTPALSSSSAFENQATEIQVNSTLRLLREIENLKEQDLELDDDDDILCRAANFDLNEKLYTDLVKLKISSKCHTKRLEIPKQSTRQDILPNSQEFLKYSLEPEFSSNSIAITMAPEEIINANTHDFYMRKKFWKY